MTSKAFDKSQKIEMINYLGRSLLLSVQLLSRWRICHTIGYYLYAIILSESKDELQSAINGMKEYC